MIHWLRAVMNSFCSGITDFFNDTITATVNAGKTTLADFLPSFDTTMVPAVTGFMPSTADSLAFNQAFTFTFNIPMDRDSVQKAFTVEPAVNLLFEWGDKGRMLTVRPAIGFTGKTSYINEADNCRLFTMACAVAVRIPGQFRDKIADKACD